MKMNVVEIILYAALCILTFGPNILPGQMQWQTLGLVMGLISTHISAKWRRSKRPLFFVSIALTLVNAGALTLLVTDDSFTYPLWVQMMIGVPTVIVFLYVSWISVRRFVNPAS